jgi:nicotinamidase-related amidase
MKTALLVVDVQRELCEGERRAYQAGEVIGRINRVSEKARAAGALVIFIQHESASGELRSGTRGWELARGLNVEPADLRVRKTGSDSFHRTELEEVLKRHGVTDLVICGMHTEFCVDSTARRALALGYPVVLVADGHTSEDKRHMSAAEIIRHHNETLSNITSYGPRVRAVPADELVIENEGS